MAVIDTMTEADVLKLAEMDKDFKKALENHNPTPAFLIWIFRFMAVVRRLPLIGSPVYTVLARRVAGRMRTAMEQRAQFEPDPDVTEKEIMWQARDGYTLHLRLYSPAAAAASSKPKPLMVVYHGGGSTIGHPKEYSPLCRAVVKRFDCVCVSPQYRLAPENPFPQAINDAWDALKWVAENAQSLGASPDKGFIIAGVSAGGNMTAVLSHLARDEGLAPPLTGVILQNASVLPPCVVPDVYRDRYLSRPKAATVRDPVLSPELHHFFMVSNNADEHSPLYAPFIWPTGHAGLPPTYLQVSGMDMLRDEELLYERVLDEAGVATKVDIYPGLPHIFWSMFPGLEQSRKQREDTLEAIGWLLQEATTTRDSGPAAEQAKL